MKEYVLAHFQSLASLAIRALSVLAGFLITFFIGRNLGPLANGQYALIAQTAMFLSVVAVGGMDMAVVRRFSATMVHKIPLARGALARALGYSIGVGLIIVVVLVIGGDPLLGWLFDRDLPEHALLFLCILLLVRTTTRLTAAVLRSQDSHLRGQTVEVLIIPACVCVVLATGVVKTLPELLWVTAGFGIAAAVYGVTASLSYTARRSEALQVPFGALFQSSLPLWLNAIALNIAEWYSLATAATSLSVYDAGLFRVAFQIGSTLSFVAFGMYNVFTARISAALASGDIERVARLSRAATRLAAVLIAPVVAVLFLGAAPLLRLIGPEFEQAAPLLRVVLVGQALYVLSGPGGLVLAMTGHERMNSMISASVTLVLLFLAPVAVQFYGLFGLAVVAAAVPFAGNVANGITVYRVVRINVITGRYRPRPRERTDGAADLDGDGAIHALPGSDRAD